MILNKINSLHQSRQRKRCPTPRHERSNDQGAVTVLAISMAICALVFIPVVCVMTWAIVAKHKLQGAADLAAIAGAHTLYVESAFACDSAEAVAQANGVALSVCHIAGDTVEVETTSVSHLPWRIADVLSISARARAGIDELDP